MELARQLKVWLWVYISLQRKFKDTPFIQAPITHLSFRPLLEPLLLWHIPMGLWIQAGERHCVDGKRGSCAANSKATLPMRSQESHEHGLNRFHINTLGKGGPREWAEALLLLLTAWQYTATVNEVFLKGALLGNGVISSRKIYVRCFHCHNGSLAPYNTAAQPRRCEHCIRLLKVKP